MEETWTIEKNYGLGQSLLAFLLPLGVFFITFINFYLLNKTTSLLWLISPWVVGIFALSFLPKILSSMRDFPLVKQFKVNEEGVSLVLPEKSNEEKTLFWSQITSYDLADTSKKEIKRLFLKTDHEDETLEVVLPKSRLDSFTKILQNKQIPFGYVRR